MRRFEDPHSLLRDRILGREALCVIDAEFREIEPKTVAARAPNPAPTADVPRSPGAALKAWFRALLSHPR